MRIPESLDHSPLDLARSSDRVYRNPAIDCHHQRPNRYLTRVDINLDLGELSGVGRRRLGGHIRCRAHDLMLVRLMKRRESYVSQGDGTAIG